jgi:ectoine hydroxylase-related dioxygenase (phytanoyl-CoA dioxygenase family)
MLSGEQIAFYQANGYLMVEDAIEPEALLKMQQVTRDFIERSRAVSQSDDIFDLDAGHSADNPRLTRIKLPHTRHPVFDEVMRSDRLMSILHPLLGTDIRLHTSKLNTKAPGGGAAVEWHQDWAFYPHTNDDMLAVGIMLEDVSEENGPLMVIPGSHDGPVLSHFAGGVFCGAVDPDDPQFDLSKAVTLTGRAGSLSLHHVRLLHGSAPNRSERPRMLLFYECGAADAWPINGIAGGYAGLTQGDLWQKMQDHIISGSQPAAARLEKVPAIMPVPPAPDSTSIFKVQASGGAKSAFA